MSGEDGEGLSWPETIVIRPRANVRAVFSCVVVKSIEVEFPAQRSLCVKILLKDRRPLLARNSSVNGFDHLVSVNVSCNFDIGS